MQLHTGASRFLSARFAGRVAARGAARGPRRSVALVAFLLAVLTLASVAHGAGELDPTFDGDGKVVTDFGADDVASGVAIQGDGKIVVGGKREPASGNSNFALARYNPDGSLDPTFDGDGKVLTDFGAGDIGEDVAIQADGKIVAAGLSGAGTNPFNFALARYNTNGSLDLSFGGDGRVLTDFGSNEEAFGVAIQADGKIVAAGLTGAGTNPENFALARYKPGGSLDATFDGDGRVVTAFGGND
jgi:uncharacterized delta-60 repeat protein